jgi:hypothetical protein
MLPKSSLALPVISLVRCNSATILICLVPPSSSFPVKFPAKGIPGSGDRSDHDWVVSQPPRSLAGDFLYSRKCRHFRRLAAKGSVSGEEYRAYRTEGGEIRSESLLGGFSISEIFVRERPETGCVSTETGSTVGYVLQLGAPASLAAPHWPVKNDPERLISAPGWRPA